MKRRKTSFYALFISAILLAGTAYSATGRNTGRLKVAFVGDPQVNDSTELQYARKSVYRELRERKDIDLAIFLGDIVNDSMEMLEPSKASLDSLPYPWFTIPGNHDFDIYKGRKAVTIQKGRNRDLTSYPEVFGSPDTTFSRKGVRFILMNDVIYENNSYKGGFTQRQMAYLDSVVTACSKERTLVLATHIPYSHIKDRAAADSILAGFSGKILLVSGHTHNVRRSQVGLSENRTVPELIAGASCGSWWRGVKDENGIPYSLQGCGAPRGYFIAGFGRNGYTLEYKCIGKPEDFRASVWCNPVQGDSTRLIVNVFGGSTEGKVVIRSVGSRKSGKTLLERTEETAPEVLEVISANKSMTKEEMKDRRAEIIPLRPFRSPHVWSVTVPGTVRAERLEIIYHDPYMSFRDDIPVRKARTLSHP